MKNRLAITSLLASGMIASAAGAAQVSGIEQLGGCNASGENGKFNVLTLKKIAEPPPYSHNGYFPTLTDMVSFHNCRDVADRPAPEVSETPEHGNRKPGIF